MKVPLIDLKRQHNEIKTELETAFNTVLDSGQFILGNQVEQFEQEIAQYLEVKYALGVGNGTDGLTLALMALKIKEGDEVITTPFTFAATAETVSLSGGIPIFVDIDHPSFNIDTRKIESKITKKTKAIIPVHLYGQGANLEDILGIAQKYNLTVIEDAAQAMGAERNGKKLGSWGEIGMFSFFPTKNLAALGDGGLLVTKDEKLYEELKMLRVHGSKIKYQYEKLGTNSRLDELQAAFLRVKLKYLDKWNKRRMEIAKLYSKALVDFVEIPKIEEGSTHIFHQYTIRTSRRNQLKAYLQERGVATAIHYSLPLHLQPAFSYLGYKEGDFPESERAAREVISLPMFSELSEAEIYYVIECISEFFKR